MTTTTMNTDTLTARMWSASEPTFSAILQHPFLTGLISGQLARDRFGHYVVQDAHYLRGYAQALSILAGRAGEEDTTAMFAAHAANAIAVERSLHADALHQMGLPTDRLPAAGPTTVAYRSYLLATAHGGSLLEGVSAVLPCYRIYWEIGKALADRTCPDPLYARWVATYGSPEFAAIVQPVLALTDRLGDDASEPERARAAEHYAMASRYEWMFFDAAYRQQSWPL